MALTTIDPGSALVVIGLQKGIVSAPSGPAVTAVVKRAAHLAAEFRRHGLPVVLINVTGRAPGRTEALPNLQGPELLALTSRDFGHDGSIPLEHCAKTIGGDDLSPHLAWTPLPPGTAQLLLVVEDVDVPLAKPAVHCVALIDPAAEHLELGALAARWPAAGVRVLRSTVGRGYHGPAPIRGHGPHRYVFQLFALESPLGSGLHAAPPDRARPRALLPTVTPPVLSRGRLTGVFAR